MEKIKDISEEAQMAQKLLTGNNITLIDAARLIKNILDFMPKGSNLTDVQFCTKIIETGKAHFRLNEMSFKDGFNLYYETKKDILRPDTSTCKTSPKPTPKSFSAEQGGAMVRVSMCSLPI